MRLSQFVPLIIVELIARICGYGVGVVLGKSSYGIERKVRGVYWSWRLGTTRLSIGRNVQLEGNRIMLGRNVRLFDGGHYVTAGTGRIEIGDDSHISRLSILSGLGGIYIGTGCAISAHVAIYSVTNDLSVPIIKDAPSLKRPVNIGNNVYIGAGVKILPGVSIGNNAIIGAGAIVTKDVPENMLAKGIPATFKSIQNR